MKEKKLTTLNGKKLKIYELSEKRTCQLWRQGVKNR